MPGSWETSHHSSVLCAILHTEFTSVAWAFGLRNLQIPGPVMGLSGMPYDHSRNAASMRAIEIGVDWLFFLDSDVIPPHDAITRLIAHNKPVISGVYCRRSPPAGVPVMIREGKWVEKIPENSVIEVDLVGAGCLLIHRSVLTSFPPQRPGKHWFDWRVDLQGLHPPGDCLSEDFTFCKAVKEKLGIPILVDTSIQCRHVGFSEAVHGGIRPLETTPNT